MVFLASSAGVAADFRLYVTTEKRTLPKKMMEPSRIRRQLGKICASPQFRAAGRLRDFLAFVVDETLAGNAERIKEYSIATCVYGRPTSFDPKLDSIVRVEAIKLRERLDTYYARDGCSDDTEIRIPKGGYVPDFMNRGGPLAGESAVRSRIEELCDTAYSALTRSTPVSLAIAADCFAQARNLNPADLRPHIGIANGLAFTLTNEIKPPADVTDQLRSSVLLGLRLKYDSADAHVVSSIYHSTLEGVNGMATAEIGTALKLEPRNTFGHLWATALLSAGGNHEASLDHIRLAIRFAPNCTLFRIFLGRLLYYAARNKETVEVLEEVAQVDPGLAIGYLWKALAYTELERHDEAVQAGSHAVYLSETSANLSAYAYVLARAGRPVDAEQILERLIAAPPFGYVSPVNLAAIAQALNRRQDVLVYLAQADRETAWALLWEDVDPRLKRLLWR